MLKMFWNNWWSQNITWLTCYKQHKHIVKMLLNQNWRWFWDIESIWMFWFYGWNSFVQYNNGRFGWGNRQYIGLNTIIMRVICTIMLPGTVGRKGGYYLVEWCHSIWQYHGMIYLLVASKSILVHHDCNTFFFKCNKRQQNFTSKNVDI